MFVNTFAKAFAKVVAKDFAKAFAKDFANACERFRESFLPPTTSYPALGRY